MPYPSAQKKYARFCQEYTGTHYNMKAVFLPEAIGLSPNHFRTVPRQKAQETGRNISEKGLKFPAATLLSCFVDFWPIPRGSSVSPVPSQQVPSELVIGIFHLGR